MNEIRFRARPFFISVTTVSAIILYLMFRGCPETSNSNRSFEHLKNDVKTDPNPFTVYAITPTYARPVQKAELTR